MAMVILDFLATVLATAVGAVLLRPMPIAAPEELLVAWGHNPTVTPSSGVEIWVKWERANPTGRSLQVTIGVTAQANL